MSYKRISGVPVQEGGTGLTTATTAYGVVCAGTTATGAFQVLNSLGTSGYVLTSQGAGALPQWVAASGGGVTSVSGTTNEITATGSTSVTLSIPSTFNAPGSITAATTITATSGAITATLGNIVVTAGNITLPKNTASVGQITLAGQRFLHSFGSGNTGEDSVFLGQYAGTLSNTGQANNAIGYEVLDQITSGSYNNCLGRTAGTNLTTGSSNILIGDPQFVGPIYGVGGNYTSSESSNICLNAAGVTAESNTLRIGAATGTSVGYLNAAYICGIYGESNSGTENLCVIDSNNKVGSSTSTSVTGSLTLSTFLAATTYVSAGTLLKLPTSSSTAGQLTINAQPFLHNYGDVTNTFVGANSGNFTLTGNHNTGIGELSLNALTSSTNNVCIGDLSCQVHTSGNGNTAVGHNALGAVTTSQHNTAIGQSAGAALTSSNDNNIYIGWNVTGTSGDNNKLTIGTGTGSSGGNLNSAFICGIQTISVTGTAVLVSTGDQLGVAVSSRRFKDNIENMGDFSEAIYKLRPVTFTLKGDDSGVITGGLIAEEVAEIMPDLVVYDKENAPMTVKYHEIPALLLNEIQKLNRRIEFLESQIFEKDR